MDLTDLVVNAGVVEDPLSRGGLARVYMGHDPDVAGLLKWVSRRHISTQVGCVVSGSGRFQVFGPEDSG